MLSGLFASNNYQGLKKMLDATVMRQEAIASNLANLETPNYKRIDVESSFSTELSKAIGSGRPSDITRLEPRLVIDRLAIAQNRDGNTVQLDSEMMKQQENTLSHNVQTQFLSGSLMKLKSAISGRTA
jgi:flagellar basal-body rod protein FlgB